jgi:hypothetical protein
VLAFPTAYFIIISLCKYVFGIPYLFDSAQPLLERVGIKEALGWNINLLILFGPLLALVLNLIPVVRMEWYNDREHFSIKFFIEKHWWNMMLVIVSSILLATLFIYALGENCRC